MRATLLALASLTLVAAQPAPVALDALLAADPAPTLAAYRLFTDAEATRPNGRVTPYTLNTPLFSDYALKHRYLFVPPGRTIGYRASGVLDFPVGTTLVKTFAYPADMRVEGSPERFLETRLLIRKADGWTAYPYVWNADGTEAMLKKAGAKLDAAWIHSDGQKRQVRWSVPNVNQCKGCHASADAIIPIDQGRRLADLARSLKGKPELVIYPGERHGFGSRIDTENGADALARTIAFLKRELN